MIKANELRIGNYVNLYVPNGKGQAITGYNPVTQIGSEYIWLGDGFRCKPEDIKPIALTDQLIFIKCGFRASWENKLFYLRPNDFTTIYLHFINNKCGLDINLSGNRFCKNVNYLHELQNLIFAITKEELEVSL